MTSEQTFLLSIRVTDSAPFGFYTATIGQDYKLPGSRRTVTSIFFPFQQRVSFTFELLADTIPEPTEAFQASVSTEDTRDIGGGILEQFPTSLNPLTLQTELLIAIADDDCKFQPLCTGRILFFMTITCTSIFPFKHLYMALLMQATPSVNQLEHFKWKSKSSIPQMTSLY